MDAQTSKDISGQYPAQVVLTLRDYFAAHAPAAPDWFVSVDQPQRPAPPAMPSNLHQDTKDALLAWGGVAFRGYLRTKIAPRDYDAADGYIAAFDDYMVAIDAWEARRRSDRLTQWAYAYSDAMLRERAK